MTGFLTGSATAMITPFRAGKVNFDALQKMMEYQIQNGTDALIMLGTTGEPSAMRAEDKEALWRFSVEQAKGRVKLIFGTGSNNLENALSMTALATKLGADGVLAVTPYYNKCTQKGLVEYYRAICSSTHLPVIAYNVPSRTGLNLLPETAAQIAELDNMAGIKEASGDMAQVLRTLRLIRGKCDLYSGDDTLTLPILAAGGTAVISVLSNLVPKAVKDLTSYVLAGRLSDANALNDRLLPLIDACFCEVNPIPVKEAMNLLGFDAGLPLPPLTPIEDGHRRKLISAMQAFGLEVRV